MKNRVLGSAIVWGLLSCSETPTQILVRVDGNLTREDVARIDFELTKDDTVSVEPWTCGPGFPYSFAVNPRSGHRGKLRVKGTAFAPSGEVLLETIVEGAFEKGRLLQLPLRFDSECVGLSCSEGESCRAGRCAPIGESSLSELDAEPKLAETNECAEFEYRGGGTAGSAGTTGSAGGGSGGTEAGSGGTEAGRDGGGVGGTAGSGGVGGSAGSGGSAGNDGDDEIIFEDDFEDADATLALWKTGDATESDVCEEPWPEISSGESSTEQAISGQRSLKINLETAGAGIDDGVVYNLVRRIPEEAAYYSAWYYLEGDPKRDELKGWFAIFDFFAPNAAGTPCDAEELVDLNLGNYGTYKRGAYVWSGVTEKEIAYSNAEFLANKWVHVEVRLDYYGPKKRQYEYYQNGVLLFTIDDLGMKKSDQPLFWRVGLSANVLTPTKAVLYIDDVKIARKRQGR